VRLELLKAGVLDASQAGIDAVFAEDLFQLDRDAAYVVREGARALGATPREVLAGLGATHLLLVDRRPGRPSERPLAELARGREVEWTISPAPGARPPPEAFLPTEMDFPLVALWAVDRPGPWMQLVALDSEGD
jgi:hypothetical protein